MNRILSQEEIDALVAATSGRDRTEDARAASAAADNVLTYNFRRPDRVSKEQLRSLHFLHDRFARNLSTSLSAFLRAMTDVSIVSVEQFAYSEFLMSLPDPTAFYSLSMAPLDGVGALELNPSVAFAMVDRMLGGTGDTPAPNRALTEIEQNVLDAVVKLILEHLTETWRGITDVRFRIQGRETRPSMLQVTGPNEVVILLAFDMGLGPGRGMLSISIPAAAIETMEEKVTQGWNRTQRQPTAQDEARLYANLGRVTLPVTTILETKIGTRELLTLQPGDVMTLGHSANAPVAVNVGGVRRFSGRLTSEGGTKAVLIEQLSNSVGTEMVLAGAEQ
ncbi:MAG TPA: flagellar motor switch protein FliM [Vicinamibacterales bacterium]